MFQIKTRNLPTDKFLKIIFIEACRNPHNLIFFLRKPGMGIHNAELMLISNPMTDLRKMPHKNLSEE